MKQRFACALLAGILLFSLPGCKKADTKTDSKDQSAVSQADARGWSELSEQTGIRFQKPQDSSDNFTAAPLGSVDKRTYTNPYLGFTFTMDRNWSVLPAEDLQDLTEFSMDILSESDFGEYITAVPQFCDVMAITKDNRLQINVMYQKLPGFLQNHFGQLTEEEFIDSLLANQSFLTGTYADINLEVTKLEKKTVTFLGEPHTALYTQFDAAGTSFYILQLVNLGLSPYTVSITLGSIIEDHTDELLQYFSPI